MIAINKMNGHGFYLLNASELVLNKMVTALISVWALQTVVKEKQ